MSEVQIAIERCQSALGRLPRSVQPRAQELFNSELRLIDEVDGWSSLLAAFELTESQRAAGVQSRVIGAGCSSFLAWLLGLSPVDPLEYPTNCRRFWIAAAARPVFHMVYDSMKSVPTPVATQVAIRPMSALETVVSRLEKKFGDLHFKNSDRETFNTLAEPYFEERFAITPISALVSIIRPTRIIELAEIIAISQIQSVSPEHVEDYMAQECPSLADPCPEDRLPCPMLFQETVIDLLIRWTNLPYRDAYRLLQRGARATAEQVEPLTAEIEAQISSRLRNPLVARSFAGTILNASRVALCRAHCIGEAITIYRAAYFRTHFESAFNSTLTQMAA